MLFTFILSASFMKPVAHKKKIHVWSQTFEKAVPKKYFKIGLHISVIESPSVFSSTTTFTSGGRGAVGLKKDSSDTQVWPLTQFFSVSFL